MVQYWYTTRCTHLPITPLIEIKKDLMFGRKLRREDPFWNSHYKKRATHVQLQEGNFPYCVEQIEENRATSWSDPSCPISTVRERMRSEREMGKSCNDGLETGREMRELRERVKCHLVLGYTLFCLSAFSPQYVMNI